jgi:glycosyltransferase involved in cell wall biosynthesis
MLLGIVIEETWDFFNEVYIDLTNHYPTTLFKRRSWQLPIFHTRINRYLFHHDLQAFMRANDLIFFEWASELLATATFLRKTCGIITRLHRYEMYQWVDRVNWQAVDKVILVSQAMQREFAARFPDQASKTVVIPVSVSLHKFRPQAKPFQGDIGILCHLTPRKRVYDLILTFYELLQNGDNFHLHIAGGSNPGFKDYFLALHYIVEQLDLRDRVTFYGHIDDTRNWYHQIDIFISNSYSEGLQVAPMEAMASGVYCLSHKWNGAEELLPEENLYFTNHDLKEKILEYCAAPADEKQRQREKMRSIAWERFDINQTTAQIRQVIEEIGAGTFSISDGRR